MAIGDIIEVNDRMQTEYRYELAASAGKDFFHEFQPCFSPQEMLEMGVFEGKYCNDCTDELPKEWFREAKISETPDASLNYFGIKSRQPLRIWRQNGWIYGPDPRGWFQWYCRYYLGRRLPEIDAIQIKRWKAFARHAGQIRANCEPGDIFCRRRQRQALLQWSYDPLIELRTMTSSGMSRPCSHLQESACCGGCIVNQEYGHAPQEHRRDRHD